MNFEQYQCDSPVHYIGMCWKYEMRITKIERTTNQIKELLKLE